MPQIKTSNENWLDRSSKLYNSISTEIEKLYTAQMKCKEAVNAVAMQRDIGSLSIPVTVAQLEELNEKRRTLVSFCNSVHYEIVELIDNPFSMGMSETVQSAYELDPSNITVNTDKIGSLDEKNSLTNLIGSTIIDDELKADFEKKAKNLDDDKLSDTLDQDIQEARFWKDEFIKAEECKKVAEEIFTPEVRANWNSMTAEERKAIIEKYVNQLSEVLGDGSKIHDKIDYDAEGYGYASSPYTVLFWEFGSRTVSINPDCVDNPQKNYSVDKVIDTLTHETRHIYQYEVCEDPEKYNAPDLVVDDWSAEYIDSEDNYRQYYHQSVEEDAKAFAALARPSAPKLKE